ncbi:MAG: MFS transporter [Bacteroidales bacterium]|nr:MFS transporter [Bacteroidales bacterium]
MQQSNSKSPWLWIPTLYFVEGIPYFIVNTISLIMFKDMGMDNGTLSLLTSLISLPWVVKPLWSPFVDIFRSKRWWIVTMQVLMLAAIGLIAATVRMTTFTLTLILFIVAAFASATHDIAADGFYMLALDKRQQSAFVGIRSTFYRIASVFGQGVLVVMAGMLEKRLGDIPAAWSVTMIVSAAILVLMALYHAFILPRPADDRKAGEVRTAGDVAREFGEAFASFFRKKGIWIAIAFMLLYRLPEAFSVKMLFPFFRDPVEVGGLGFTTDMYGVVFGTFGVIALLAGGILGGLAAARLGLRKCLWPMALSLALPCAVYLYMSIAQPESLWTVGACVVFDQTGYGFGFSAYMLYMMHFSEGPLKTSHYAICTAFMALSMVLPGLVAGYLQEALGYVGFFILVMICCLATFFVTFFARRRLPSE